MNRYIVEVAYEKYVFDEGEAALSFAEVAKGHVVGDAGVTIEIEEIITETEEAEDGR